MKILLVQLQRLKPVLLKQQRLKLLPIILLSVVSLGSVADPLFDSDKTLKMTLTGPFEQIDSDRNREKRYPAQLQWGGSLSLPVELQVRGHNRLRADTCTYPPLKFHLEKKDTKGTLFEKQKELKMVVACKMKYFDYVRMEYLVYKMYEMLSDNHFKVRWLDITYIEDEQQRNAPGFFIEQKKRMGMRLGLTQVHQNGIPVTNLDQQHATRLDLFQFMIGNTDYSNRQARGDADCCHNTKLMSLVEDDSAKYIPVPYDFDYSGIINARYAAPPPFIPIRNVTDRSYRGLCIGNDQLAGIIPSFQELKNDIMALIETDTELSKRMKKRSLKYLGRFYKILGDPKKFDRFVTNACRS